ncbi:MAG: hypothetical protein ACE149_17520 [Armatimonadota bacterium]
MSATTASTTPTSQDATPSVLYISTELDTWETSTPEPDQDQICERCGYRRLDPNYYAWLRHRMTVAQQFRRSGRLSAAQYQTWRTRFNAVHAWAMTRFGEDVLVAAVEALDPKAYRPPQVEEWEPGSSTEPPPAPVLCFPADGDWPFTELIALEAVTKVDAIRDQALALGWTEAGLYQNRGRSRFPVGGDYGLVCLLHPGDRIGEVSAQFIELIRPSGSRLRCYNRDVPQPWIRDAAARASQEDSDTSASVPVSNK